jgi:hypothetical protein
MIGAAVLLLLAGGIAVTAALHDPSPAHSTSELPEGAIRAVALYPAMPETLAIAMDAGLYRSHDGGATWQVLPWPEENSPVTRLLFAQGETGALYAAGLTGLFFSPDGDDAW